MVPKYIALEMEKALKKFNEAYPTENGKYNDLNAKKDTTLSKLDEIVKEFNADIMVKYGKAKSNYDTKNNTYQTCKKIQAELLAAWAITPGALGKAALLKGLSSWLVLLVIILILIFAGVFMAFLWGLGRRKPSKSNNRSRNNKPGFSFLPTFMNPGYSFSMMFNRFAFVHSKDGEDRPIVKEGRCGGKWVDAGGSCYNSQSPTSYKVLDQEPNEDGKDVYMPFLIQDTFFLPQCEETFVYDDNGNAQLTKYLYYKDKGMSCTKLSNPTKRPAPKP